MALAVFLESASDGEQAVGYIGATSIDAIAHKVTGWKFPWEKMKIDSGKYIYQLTSAEPKQGLEGLLLLSVVNGNMVYMNNIEIAPHNFGSGRRYSNAAGLLIAYACAQSFEMGRSDYNGFLTFDSKTALVELYRTKYGATQLNKTRLFIDPSAGKHLIQQYLHITPYS